MRLGTIFYALLLENQNLLIQDPPKAIKRSTELTRFQKRRALSAIRAEINELAFIIYPADLRTMVGHYHYEPHTSTKIVDDLMIRLFLDWEEHSLSYKTHYTQRFINYLIREEQ